MAYTGPVTPTAVEGLVNDSNYNGNTPSINPAIVSGRELCFAGQTSNQSGSSVANQAIGTAAVPSGTANGATITVNNSLVGANSLIFTQLTGSGGTITEVVVPRASIVPGTSFGIQVQTSGATTAAVDVWYWIVN